MRAGVCERVAASAGVRRTSAWSLNCSNSACAFSDSSACFCIMRAISSSGTNCFSCSSFCCAPSSLISSPRWWNSWSTSSIALPSSGRREREREREKEKKREKEKRERGGWGQQKHSERVRTARLCVCTHSRRAAGSHCAATVLRSARLHLNIAQTHPRTASASTAPSPSRARRRTLDRWCLRRAASCAARRAQRTS